MKKLTKSLVAVALSAAMVLTSTPAMAAEQTSTGAGAFENDDSAVPVYDATTLPTVGSDTYNFTIDPQKLLNKYDSTKYPDATATLLFHTVDEEAEIAAVATAQIDNETIDGMLYTHEKVDATINADLKPAITVAASEITDVAGGIYLWVPNDDTTEIDYDGDYLEITADNIDTYFDIVLAATEVTSIAMKANHNAGDVVCSTQLYKDEYVECSYKATDYVTLTADGSAIDTETVSVNGDINLYVKSSTKPYTQITKTNLATYVEFTAATKTYKGDSNKLSIINKSTKKKTVTAKITVTNATGLTFKPSATFTSDTSASVYLAITDGASPVAVAVSDSVASATKTFTLEPADESDAIIYQTDAIDSKTGGHVYKRYIQPDDGSKYTSCDFYITGAANGEEGAATAWNAYNKALEASQSAAIPGLTVVYSINDYVDTYTLTGAGDNAPTFQVNGATVTSAAEGDEVTIVPAVVDGKVVDTVKYTPSGEEAVTVTPVSGAYKFTMPAKAVSVAVTYKVLLPSVAETMSFDKSEDGETIVIPFVKGNATTGVTDVIIEYAGVYYNANTAKTDYNSSSADEFTIDNEDEQITLSSNWVDAFQAGSTYTIFVVFDNNYENGQFKTLTLSVTD